MSSKKTSSDLDDIALAYQREGSKALFRELVQSVRYQDFDHIPVGQFHRLCHLAMMDHWTDYDEGKKAEKVGVESAELLVLRKIPEYAELEFQLVQSMEKLRDSRTLTEHVNDPLVQDKVARATIRDAVYSVDGRVRGKAQEMIHDRAMPRVQKGDTAKIIMISADTLHLLEETERQLIDVESRQIQSPEDEPLAEEG